MAQNVDEAASGRHILLHLLEGAITALPCFAMAGILLATWIDPMSVDNGRWVRFGVGIMVLEFVLVHSGAFMSAQQGKANWQTLRVFATGFAFYGAFAGAMAYAFKSWMLFFIYTAVMVTRWASMVTRPAEAAGQAKMRSGLSILYYLIAAFASVLVPWPEFGVTSSIVRDVYPDRGGGEWERNPETALAAGVIYFVLLGITELVIIWRSLAADRNTASPR